ncbi:MAG: Eco57I restriction-modification methylase domain-containing protein, partial [Treponema sp.]|nr:Eco57I restriction-modification methylase domain-containing protein [Treponema sp.]
ENNIKCGNSLVGTDFYSQGDLGLTEEEQFKINCFDWEKEFPAMFKVGGGGFDAVIGNPPYVLMQTLDDKAQFKYLSKKYKAATYKIDTYQVFMEKAIQIAKPGGYTGFITPNSFLRNKFAVSIRNIILKQSQLKKLCLFYYPVFQAASVDTLIFIAEKTTAEKTSNDKDTIVEIEKHVNLETKTKTIYCSQNDWLKNDNLEIEIIENSQSVAISDKIQKTSIPFGIYGTAYFGIQTHDRKKYVATEQKSKNWQPVIDGSNIQNFFLDEAKEYVCCEKKAIKSGGKDAVYQKERICTRQIGETPVATIVTGGIYTLNTVYNLYFNKQTDYSLKFILGILMSNAFKFYWKMKYFDEKKTFPKIKKDALLAMPIPALDLSHKADKEKHDNLVSLVDKMFSLKSREHAEPNPQAKTVLQRQIEALDSQIDETVYALYGLTEEEIKAVEGEHE